MSLTKIFKIMRCWNIHNSKEYSILKNIKANLWLVHINCFSCHLKGHSVPKDRTELLLTLNIRPLTISIPSKQIISKPMYFINLQSINFISEHKPIGFSLHFQDQ